MLRHFVSTLGILVATCLTTNFLMYRTGLFQDKNTDIKHTIQDSAAGVHPRTLSKQVAYNPVATLKPFFQNDGQSQPQDESQQNLDGIVSDKTGKHSTNRSYLTTSTNKPDLFPQDQTSNLVSPNHTVDTEQHTKRASFPDLSPQEPNLTSDSQSQKKSENNNFHHRNDSLPIIPKGDDVHGIDTCSTTSIKHIGFYDLTVWLKDYPGQEMFQGCEYSCCSINTTVAFKKNTEHLDALFFNPYLLRADKPPVRPKQDQIWIFLSIEPPPYTSRSAWTRDSWKGLFNWTMTYRHDSDIVLPYITIEKDMEPHRKQYDSILAKKTKTAMWTVSHCNAVSRRDEYIRMLNKTYSVDIFGKCGTLRCQDCEAIYERYKFLIAFENSFCLDYISEKAGSGLMHDIVPIVRGAGNHSQLFPPGTYIDAAEFNSVEELGDHLNYLESNDTAYLQYLKNKEGYTFHRFSIKTKKASYCQLCKKLHNLGKYGNMIPDMANWLDKCDKDIVITEYKMAKMDDDHDDNQDDTKH